MHIEVNEFEHGNSKLAELHMSSPGLTRRVFLDKRHIELLGSPCCLLFAILYFVGKDLNVDTFHIETVLEGACQRLENKPL